MADDDLRIGDILEDPRDSSDPIDALIRLLIQLMILAVVLYAFYHIMLTLLF